MHEALRDHMGGSKYSLVVCLLRICKAGVDGLSGLEGCLQKSASLLFRSSQALSGWTDTFRCLQRSLGSDWSTRGPSQLSPNQLWDGGGQEKFLSGHSDWWSSALVVDLQERSPIQDLSQREHWELGHACS